MRNQLLKFPFIILIIVLAGIASFAYISVRLLKHVNSIDEKAAHATETLVQVLNIQRAILDIENNTNLYILDPNLESASLINQQTEIIKKEIDKLKIISIGEVIELTTIDSMLYYIEKRIEISLKLVLISKEKSINEAIDFRTSSLLKGYQLKTRSIINQIETMERLELQNYLDAKEKDVVKLNLFLFSVFILLVLLVSGNLIQLRKANRQKEKEIKSTKYVEKILSSISDSVITTDSKFKVKSWNSAAEKLYGFVPEKVRGKDIADAVRSLMDEDEIKQIRKEMDSKGYWNGEVMHLNGEGQKIFVQSFRSALRDENGKITGYVSSNRDITQKKLADQLLIRFNQELAEKVKEKTKEIKENEKRLEESAAKYEGLVEQSLTGIYIILGDYFTYVNPQFAKIFGYSEEEMLTNIKAIDVVYGPDQDLVKNTVEARLTGKTESPNYNFRGIKKDGTVIFVEVFAARAMQGDQAVTIGTLLDITKSKKAEEEIRKSNERFMLIGATTHDAIWERNVETNEIWGNEMHQHLYGLTIADPVPTEEMWIQNLHPDERETIVTNFKKILDSDKNVWIEEYRFQTIEGDYKNIYDRTYIVRNKAGKPTRMIGNMMDITERKKTEEIIRAGEEVRRLIMDAAMDAIICINTSGKITVWNPQAEKIFGWKEKEIIGKTLTETIIPNQYREHHQRGFKEYLETSDGPMLRKPFEITALKQDGEEFPVELNIMPIKNGETEFFCAFIRDITESKKAESDLRLTKESYFTLMSNVDGIVWEADAKTFNFSFVSKQAERLLGYPVEQWLNEPGFWASHIYEEDREWAVQYCVQCTLDKKAHEFEYRIVASDGRIVWLRDIVSVQIENDQPVKLAGLMIDITEAKKAEQAIRQSEEKYRSLIEQASEPIIIYSLDGTIHEFNRTAYEISGYSKKEFSKLRLNDILVGDIIVNKKNQDALLDGNIITINRQVRKKDGTNREMEFVAKLIEDNKILAFGRDITERKRNEEAIKKEKELSDSIINSLPGIFYIFDQTPKLIRWNKKFEEISGYNETELIKITPMSIFHKDDRLLMKQTIENTYKTGVGETEARLFTKDGKIVPFILTGIAIEYEGELCILGTGIDIEKRKSTELALTESENFLRTIIQAEPECVKLLDKNGLLEEMNSAGLEMIEADCLQQVKGHSVLNIICEPYRNDFVKLTNKVFHGKSGKLEFEIIGLKGTHRWLETHATPLKNAEGKIVSLLGVTRDITKNKQAAEIIIKEKELSESIISNLPDIFYLFDKEGKFLRWNKNFEKILGYTKKEIATITPFDLFESPIKEPLLDKLKEIIQNGKVEFEGNVLSKDGNRIPYFFKGWRIHYEGNSCIIGIGVDMTNRKIAEELLKKSYEDIRRLASHLEQVREEERIAIAREIHDELGQQLTVLKMDISWLDSKMAVKEDLVQKKMDDLLATIDNTVKSVRKISSELRPSILDDLGLITALEWHAQEFENRSGVKTKFKSEVGELKLPVNRATSIYRIFQESLTNIARHAKATKVTALIKKKNNELIMTIQDDGKGFDPLVIGNKKTLGILGMRERADIMGGEFTITSNIGKGTVSTIRIPLSNET